MTRMEAEFVQREAPPSYGQLIAQGLIPPVEDFPVYNPTQVAQKHTPLPGTQELPCFCGLFFISRVKFHLILYLLYSQTFYVCTLPLPSRTHRLLLSLTPDCVSFTADDPHCEYKNLIKGHTLAYIKYVRGQSVHLLIAENVFDH